tara:strand:+ start:1724 stop:1912 length:189 start_codon:yes stop_codon:yes gene_type:complete
MIQLQNSVQMELFFIYSSKSSTFLNYNWLVQIGIITIGLEEQFQKHGAFGAFGAGQSVRFMS